MNAFRLLPLFALLLAASCDQEEASAAPGIPLTRSYQLEYLQPAETLRALQSLNLDPSVTIRADNDANRIVATFDRKEDGRIIAELLEKIDVPTTSTPTRFIELEFIDAGTAAEAITAQLPTTKDPSDIQFHIIPDTRTNRVFLMGTVEQIEQAESMLAELDVAKPL